MQNNGSAGIDLANNDRLNLCRFNECPNSGTQRQGSVNASQTNLRNFSAKLISNSSWQARSNLNLKTTIGGDYNNLETDGVSDGGTNLPPGAQNPFQAAVKSVGNNITNLQTVNKTLGLYVQEEMAYRDRMFLTLAERTDQNSSFGTKFQRVVYPKAQLSWILSDESFFPHPDWLNQFRLRSALGASGVQPGGNVALQTFTSSTSNIAAVAGSATSSDSPGLLQNALGNPNLKPETATEWESGFESNVLNNRVHIDVTYYTRKTHDAIISEPIAASSGASALSVLKNLGSVQNTGIEFGTNATIIDRRSFGWDISVSASHNSNKILNLGIDPTTGKARTNIGTGTTRDSIGLPVNAWVLRPFTYKDANSDGIITPDEVTTGAGFIYYGYSQPRDIIAVTNGIDLFERHLRLSVLDRSQGRIQPQQRQRVVLRDELRDVVVGEHPGYAALGSGAQRGGVQRQESGGDVDRLLREWQLTRASARSPRRGRCRSACRIESVRATRRSCSPRAISTSGPTTPAWIRKRTTATATSRTRSRRRRRARTSASAPISTTNPTTRLSRMNHQMNTLIHRIRTTVVAGGVVAGSVLVGACNPKQELLSPQQPGVIAPSDVANSTAADALYTGALGRWKNSVNGNGNNTESLWNWEALFTDEVRSADTFSQRNDADQRNLADE